ncbi:serine/threonine-protein kinase [Janibacter limosus]|uniref:serine/threonine-protein kinase n=1 Tax=Janibacter limosus TaxID=53458 RepID=UPI000AE10DD1|nr:serine/threonine-protein kinase [Janibacter limosus]
MTDDTTPGLIGDRYETVRPIGRGGMGIVWLARDTVLGRQVAIKQIGDFPGESEGETRRAMREARAAAALNHPNVVAVYDVTEHEGTPWLVMEYVAGPTLASAIRERGPMTPKGAADLGAQLAGALAAAHRAGIVHRDVKPANVLIGGGRPKLGDFGIARAGADDQLTQTGLVTGTPSYMAPEVAVGDDHGEAADVWALGATIYFAVEGQDAYPPQGNALATLRSIAAHPPRRPERAGPLEPVLADMLSRDVSRRGSMTQVLRRLESIAAGGHGVAPVAATSTMAPPHTPGMAQPGRGPQGPAPRRGGGWLWALLAAGLVALLVGGIAFAMTRGDGSDGSAGASGATGGDRTTASRTTTTSEPKTTTETTTQTETASPSSSSSTSSSETSDEGITEAEGRAFVEDYFSTVTSDRDAAWDMLAPERQADRSGYDDFWSGITSVTTSDITVDEDSGAVTVTLTYHPKDRDKTVEQHTYALTRIDGQIRMTK